MSAVKPPNEPARLVTMNPPIEKIGALEKSNLRALVAATIALLIVAATSVRSLQQFRAAADRTAHAQQVIEKAERVVTDAAEVQNGERGYVITGEPRFLASYAASVALVMPHLQELRALVADDPVQRPRVDEVVAQAANRLSVIEKIIEMQKTQGAGAVKQAMIERSVQTGAGQTRVLVNNIVDEERQEVAQLQAQASISARITLAAIGIVGVLAIGILGVAAARIRRETAARREALLKVDRLYAELTALNASLETKVASRTAELQAAEVRLSAQVERVIASERESVRNLAIAEESRRGLLTAMAEEKRAGERLRESEERFRQLAEHIDKVFWIQELGTPQLLYLSPAFEEIWGRPREDLLAQPRTWIETIHQDDRERIAQAVSIKQVRGDYDETYRIIRPDGTLRWIRDRAYPIADAAGQVYRIVGTAEDISERRMLEEQLRRTQRMEAIGALSSGIAHDLNNILAPVLMAPALLRLTAKDERERELLALIEQSARRGADVIKQLLTFSRGSGGERVPLQVRHLLKEMQNIVTEMFPREITVQFDTATDLPLVAGDATQLHQVLLNLCVNARDAMPTGGQLTVQTRNIEVPAEQVRLHPLARPGPHILIAVRDTGHGIPHEIIERIFDPFFTTKELGKGTGLGLSTVLGIVRSHGGFVEVESAPGRGALFRIFLPASITEQPALPGAEAGRLPRGLGEFILVVDDERTIREATRLVLEHHGYRVILATNGAEALGIFRQRMAEISLVVTDVMMPVMNGVDLLRQMRELRPDLKVLVTSGMASDSKQAELAALGITELLPKPCEQRDLLKAVARQLARAK